MTQFTTNDMAIRVLRDLNVIGAEEVPSDADFQYVLETIRSEFAMMEHDGIQFGNEGTSVDSINHVLFTELSRRFGFAVAPAFGIMNAAQAEAGITASENRIRKLVAPIKTPELLVIERTARGTRIRDPIISQ